jgi:hypothetical protein
MTAKAFTHFQASSNAGGTTNTPTPVMARKVCLMSSAWYVLKGKARPFCSSSLMVSSPHRLVSSMKGGEQIRSSRAKGGTVSTILQSHTLA